VPVESVVEDANTSYKFLQLFQLANAANKNTTRALSSSFFISGLVL